MKEQKVKSKTNRVRGSRLTIDCSSEQKKKIKMLAASKDMSITDFMLQLFEEKYSRCPFGLNHVPNADTIAPIEFKREGKRRQKLRINECFI